MYHKNRSFDDKRDSYHGFAYVFWYQQNNNVVLNDASEISSNFNFCEKWKNHEISSSKITWSRSIIETTVEIEF